MPAPFQLLSIPLSLWILACLMRTVGVIIYGFDNLPLDIVAVGTTLGVLTLIYAVAYNRLD